MINGQSELVDRFSPAALETVVAPTSFPFASAITLRKPLAPTRLSVDRASDWRRVLRDRDPGIKCRASDQILNSDSGLRCHLSKPGASQNATFEYSWSAW